MKRKTLSIVMANYNYDRYIGEALDAILCQSYSPHEVIVVDDASTDNSVTIVENLMEKHPNLRLLRNGKNMGALHALKKGLDIATGEYIYSAASDDKVLPGFFEKSMDLLKKYPQAGLCCADTHIIGEKGFSEGEVRPGFSSVPCYFSPTEAVNLVSSEAFTPILPHTAILRRSALDEAGGYREDLKGTCDTFAHHVIIFRNGFCYVPEVLATVRFHSAQNMLGRAVKPRLERELVETQIKAIKNPAYSDVLPLFKRTARFSIYPWQVFRVVASRRENWDFLSFRLLQLALYDLLIRSVVRKILPRPLRVLARRYINGFRRMKHIISGRFKGGRPS
ncbi:glycosyltransferase family 2 protein [Candidatus Margulisiibacteriota bacterium]